MWPQLLNWSHFIIGLRWGPLLSVEAKMVPHWIMGLIWFQATTLHSNETWRAPVALFFFFFFTSEPPHTDLSSALAHSLFSSQNLYSWEKNKLHYVCKSKSNKAASCSQSYCWIYILHVHGSETSGVWHQGFEGGLFQLNQLYQPCSAGVNLSLTILW